MHVPIATQHAASTLLMGSTKIDGLLASDSHTLMHGDTSLYALVLPDLVRNLNAARCPPKIVDEVPKLQCKPLRAAGCRSLCSSNALRRKAWSSSLYPGEGQRSDAANTIPHVIFSAVHDNVLSKAH